MDLSYLCSVLGVQSAVKRCSEWHRTLDIVNDAKTQGYFGIPWTEMIVFMFAERFPHMPNTAADSPRTLCQPQCSYPGSSVKAHGKLHVMLHGINSVEP
jgi:hypothetical protein